MAGQQAIQAAVIRGQEVPQGHVVAEEWPKQTYGVAKPTKSWAIKCREKEAKNGIGRTSKPVLVKRRNRKLAPRPRGPTSKSSRPKNPSRCKRESGPNSNRKPKAGRRLSSENNASKNKKSSESKCNRSERSINEEKEQKQ